MRVWSRTRRFAVSTALLLVAAFTLISPVHAQTNCNGQNGSIADYGSPVYDQLSTQLENIAGTYCNEAKGAENVDLGATVTGLACSLSVTRSGAFKFVVGGNETSWTQTLIMLRQTGERGVEHFYILGGTAEVFATFEVQDNRLVRVRTLTANPSNPDGTVYRVCDFGYVSHAAGGPGTSRFASGNSLPLASVGTFGGLRDNYAYSCKLNVKSTGQIDLIFKSPSGTVSSSGDIRGRFFDSITEFGIQSTVGNSQSWNKSKEVIYGPSVSLSSTGAPMVATATINGEDYSCDVGDGTVGFPSCSGISCYPEFGGVGKASCVATVGNPINVVTGNKFQREADYTGSGSLNLELVRYYNSNSSVATGSMGSNWRTNFDWTLRLDSNKTRSMLIKPDGQVVRFEKLEDAWFSVNDRSYLMRPAVSGDPVGATWILAQNGETMSFGPHGYLRDISYPNGRRVTLSRDNLYRLAKVADQSGRSLIFTHDEQSRVRTMKDPTDGIYTYHYTDNMLTKVERPGSSGSVVRQYKYENPLYPEALTGIIDENGVRFATWAYDGFGRVYSSEHANGVDKYSVEFGENQSAVIDPLGSTRTYSIETHDGGMRITGVSQPAGAGCDAAFSSAKYDNDGNLESATDFKGVVTTYVYEKLRRLVTAKTEAFGRPEQRTTTTKWHASYRSPVIIAEPKRLTTLDYFADGKLKTRALQNTQDESGKLGLAVIGIGPVSTWAYSYNAQGQVDTVTGPREGGIDKTTYAYYPITGDLQSIKNAAGHVTTFADYDNNGRARLIVDPNNMPTRIVYSANGLPLTYSVSDGTQVLTTTFSYDNVGQVDRLTLADKSYISFTYDDAHRLTEIKDSAGNTVKYTLNSMGSREREEVLDEFGILKRRISREFDGLNRVKDISGAGL